MIHDAARFSYQALRLNTSIQDSLLTNGDGSVDKPLNSRFIRATFMASPVSPEAMRQDIDNEIDASLNELERIINEDGDAIFLAFLDQQIREAPDKPAFKSLNGRFSHYVGGIKNILSAFDQARQAEIDGNAPSDFIRGISLVIEDRLIKPLLEKFTQLSELIVSNLNTLNPRAIAESGSSSQRVIDSRQSQGRQSLGRLIAAATTTAAA